MHFTAPSWLCLFLARVWGLLHPSPFGAEIVGAVLELYIVILDQRHGIQLQVSTSIIDVNLC